MSAGQATSLRRFQNRRELGTIGGFSQKRIFSDPARGCHGGAGFLYRLKTRFRIAAITTPRRPRERFHGRVDAPDPALCAEPGCDQPGEFRAPVSNRTSAGWKYLCLDHVRAFNAAYSFEDDGVKNAVPGWERQTRAFAANAYAGGFDDPIGVMRARMGGFAAPKARAGHVLDKADLNALRTLDLDENASFTDIRARYKEKVRVLHPDANGGDRTHEAELRRVIDAYTHLKESPAFGAEQKSRKS
ncbi:J domain-containing protein [Sphingosinicella soli]|uniref:J domain-containing protein n=1 Tax=Sphingosinicella soli TaxID=333708 RepID=A0A7W7F6P0_9SPHN|nr:hypothetical protein [Sphingosinicella soli]